MVLRLAESEIETFGKLKLKNLFKNVVKGIKKLSLAPMRHSFLSLVILNAFHFASRMKKQIDSGNESALKSKWEKLGGSYAELKKVILSGAKKKGFLEDETIQEGISYERLCELHNQFETYGDAEFSERETFAAVQVGAVLALATSIIVALKPFLKKTGEAGDTSPDVTDPAIVQSLSPESAIDPTKPENETKFDKNPVGSQGFDMKKIVLFGGVGLGALLIFSMARKK